MNNQRKTIEQLLSTERDTITAPSRNEFRDLLQRVTNHSPMRNTIQKGVKSPFGMFLHMARNKLVIAGSLALLAVIIIIPTVKHRSENALTSSSASVSSDAQAGIIVQTAQGTVTEDIISDILQEFNTENSIISGELSADNDGDGDDDISIDSVITS